MIHLLSCREKGQLSGYHVKTIESTRRVSELELCRTKEIEQTLNSGVNSLDLEKQDNRYLIAATSNGSIAIFDTENTKGEDTIICKPVAVVDRSHPDAHSFSVETVKWYPHDTGIFITSSVDGKAKVWDTNLMQVADQFVLPGYIYSHEMSPIATKHNIVAAACENARVHLCDLRSGSATHILKGHQKAALSVAWSPRCEYVLATGSRDNQLLLWDIRRAAGYLASLDLHNGKRHSSFKSLLTAHNGHVNGLRFTADGFHLLSLGTDDRLRLWNVLTCKNTLVNYGRVMDVTRKKVQFDVSEGTSPEVVFVPNGDNISAFEIFSGKEISRLTGHFSNVNACLLEQNEQVLFSGGNDTHVLVWSPKTRTCEENDKEEQQGKKISDGVPLHRAYQDNWSSDED